MSKKPKYYVVRQGHNPGVYDNWNDCAEQVKGFSNARYKAFDTAEAAQQAFREAPEQHITSRATSEEKASKAALQKANTSLSALSTHSPKERPILMPSPDVMEKVGFSTVVVDAACAKNPGPMEYRGIYLGTGEEIFTMVQCWARTTLANFLPLFTLSH